MTDDFVNKDEALLRVEGSLASRPPRVVTWVMLICLQRVVVMVERIVTFVECKGRGRAHTLVAPSNQSIELKFQHIVLIYLNLCT